MYVNRHCNAARAFTLEMLICDLTLEMTKIAQWVSKQITQNCTVKPVYNDHLMGYFSAKGHLDELQKAESVSTSELVPSVLKHITE